MASALTIPLGGTLGSNAGAGSDGVLVGSITATDPTKGILKSLAQADGYCYADVDLVLANNEHLAIVQVAEDGSTEFAGAFMTFRNAA